MAESTKVFAFQVFHNGRVVAEAPLVVHDLEAALETAESVVAESPQLRREAAEIMALLLGAKHNHGGTCIGVCLGFCDKRTQRPTDPPPVSASTLDRRMGCGCEVE